MNPEGASFSCKRCLKNIAQFLTVCIYIYGVYNYFRSIAISISKETGFLGFFFSCFNRFLFQVLELTTTENINFLEEFRKWTILIFQNIDNNKGKKKKSTKTTSTKKQKGNNKMKKN